MIGLFHGYGVECQHWAKDNDTRHNPQGCDSIGLGVRSCCYTIFIAFWKIHQYAGFSNLDEDVLDH
jgi:hypothetical protein